MTDVVRLVLREATEECSGDCCPLAATLDACVQDAVASLWSSPIKSFVPLLALRQVRDCIRQGSCTPLSNEA